MKYKIFCDESNYMLHDKSDIMINGAIKIEEENLIKVKKYIKYLRHKYSYFNEIKWTKLIAKQLPFYKELIDYFFSNKYMQFRATLVVNKSKLQHDKFNRNHNEFYYVVYYYTLKYMLNPNNSYKIYLDYKDTQGGARTTKLKEILQNSCENIMFTIIHSHDSQLIQLSDLFTGAIGYANRQDIPKTSKIKNEVVNYLNDKIKANCYGDIRGTKPWEEKFNIFRWSPSNV